ncbi:MAG: CDP-alcohol phosphatidyltransferase family protein [Labilithrix sp.]|nr:CDP-alcohol phosphatidyltransferase family protein [Labilithrix sp.]MCW5812378.1 CDP-alcohol phosphatidyltransferase family protein [Labilithrix sp.]
MDITLDVACSVAVVALFAAALIAYRAAGRPSGAARVEREQGLVLVGRGPMHAVYRALVPLGRLLVHLGVSANAVTLFSLVAAIGAAGAFAGGHFGAGAAIACVAALADALDGLVARESGTSSPLGKVLDTTVDRYVDALFLGGIGLYVRASALHLALVLAAIVGSFMVSYASSIERELHLDDPGGRVPIRRAHRLAYVLVAATIAPLCGRYALAPVLLAVGVIALFGNVSSAQRLLRAGRHAAERERAQLHAATELAATLPDVELGEAGVHQLEPAARAALAGLVPARPPRNRDVTGPQPLSAVAPPARGLDDTGPRQPRGLDDTGPRQPDTATPDSGPRAIDATAPLPAAAGAG